MKRAVILAAFLFLLGCSSNADKIGVRIACELTSSDIIAELHSYTLTLYRNPPDQATFCAGWDVAEPWSPAGGERFDAIPGTELSLTGERTTFNFELDPGTWGFTFIAVTADYNPEDPKDLARGCLVVDLVEGHNPRSMLRIVEIIWPEPPGVCGDGTVDGDELCDDGNTIDEETCSADCLSMPVFQVNPIYDNSQLSPSISGAAGNYIIAWTSGGSDPAGESTQHVRARRFDQYGRHVDLGPFTGDVKLNSVSTLQSQYQPSVAVGSGSFMAVWIDNAPSTGVPAGDVVWRLLQYGTGTGPAEQTLNVASQEGTQDWGRVAGNGGANFFAAWITAELSPRHAVCSMYNGSTSTWIPEAPCSASASSNEYLVDTAMSFTGGFAAAWVRDAEIMVQFFDTSGERDGDEKHANTSAGGMCDYPALAFDGLGRLLVVWRYQTPGGEMQVKGRLYDAGGAPSSSEDFQIESTPLTQGPGTENNPNHVPDVAGDPSSGLFLAVWDAAGSGGGRGRIVLSHDRFGINRFIRDTPEEHFSSTLDFPITSQAFAQMDEFVVACAADNFCMVVWNDESLIVDPSSKGIRGIVVPILQ